MSSKKRLPEGSGDIYLEKLRKEKNKKEKEVRKANWREQNGDDMKTRGSLIFENFISENDIRFDRLVSPKKAAELLDVSVKFVYESIARREIQAVRVGGRLRRIRLSVLDEWLTAQRKGV